MREEIEKYINDNYDSLQEYPWDEYPNYTTFKHKNNKKWFALIMDVSFEKLNIDKEGIVNVINLKNIPEIIGGLRKENVNKRPCYFCFKSEKYYDIIWFIPVSTKIEKYQKIYNNKIQK